MKTTLKTSLLLLAVGLANPLNATVLTFDSPPAAGPSAAVPRDFGDGITGNVGFCWSGVGGGHLWLNGWNSDDSMYFASPTHVNSFNMTAPKELGAALPTGYTIDIAAYNAANTKIWCATIDLTGSSWSNWITVNMDTYDVSKIVFFGPNITQKGNLSVNNLQASIDNLTINVEPETQNLRVANVPDAGGSALIFLMGLGSLVAFRKASKRVTAN
jgi:hypothetical protein